MTPPFARGERVRILKGTGRTAAFDGYEGVVDGVTQTGVIVILDVDPAHRFRMEMAGGFEPAHQNLVVRRFFNLHELEKIENPAEGGCQ